MKGFSRAVVKLRYVILAIAIVLLIPSGIGYMKTRINYDILTYLPKNIETMKGQDILEDEEVTEIMVNGTSVIINSGWNSSRKTQVAT